MEDKFLPIGTVVYLKDAKKPLMIIGFCVISDNRVFDYSGCLYPEGVVSSDINLLFNHDQIEKIVYSGYVGEEEFDFKAKLRQIILEKNQEIDSKQINVSNDIVPPQMFTNNMNQQ